MGPLWHNIGLRGARGLRDAMGPIAYNECGVMGPGWCYGTGSPCCAMGACVALCMGTVTVLRWGSMGPVELQLY